MINDDLLIKQRQRKSDPAKKRTADSSVHGIPGSFFNQRCLAQSGGVITREWESGISQGCSGHSCEGSGLDREPTPAEGPGSRLAAQGALRLTQSGLSPKAIIRAIAAIPAHGMGRSDNHD